MSGDMIVILDFDGRYGKGVARRVRGEGVYCEILPYDAPLAEIRARAPKGLLLVGGAQESDAPDSPMCDAGVYDMGVPVLGMGYGARAMICQLGGRTLGPAVENKALSIEFGESPLFEGLTSSERYIARLDAVEMPGGFSGTARGGGLIAAFECAERRLYGTQFHVESNDPDGLKILFNFTLGICGCEKWWSMESFIEREVSSVRERAGALPVVTSVSGGVDSTVCVSLLKRAVGRQLKCVFVDTGFMREGESDEICGFYRGELGIELTRVDAKERFIRRVAGVTGPSEKRRLISEEFARIYAEEAERLGGAYLAQGTIYTDEREIFPANASVKGMIEPLRTLFKEEVRQVGELIGLPQDVIHRQSFPGAGLAIRVLGAVTESKLAILRRADAIFRAEIKDAGLDKRIGHYFAVLTSLNAADTRFVVTLRAANFVGGASTAPYRLPYDLLERVSARVISECERVERVTYDMTSRPAGAPIEWE